MSIYTVGRNADVCDIAPEHPSLSRIHAVIQLGKEGRIEIMDFHSTHGTFVNGEKISSFVVLFNTVSYRNPFLFTWVIFFNLEEVHECIH